MPGTWKKIERLAERPGFGIGDWFNLPDDVLIEPNGQPFAKKGRPGLHPAVLLADLEGPSAPFWPRSASGEEGIIHDAHPKPPGHPRCPLRVYGWVCCNVRCTVLSRQLDGAWTCTEPSESPLWDDLPSRQDEV